MILSFVAGNVEVRAAIVDHGLLTWDRNPVGRAMLHDLWVKTVVILGFDYEVCRLHVVRPITPRYY